MKTISHLRTIALLLACLVISLPFCFAEEYSLLYDDNGNLIYNEKTDLWREYNELNQLIVIKNNSANGRILQTFVWEPVEERVFIKNDFNDDGSWKSSTYYFGHDYVLVENSSGLWNTSYAYQDGTLVGYEDENGNKRYVLTEHLGSTDVVLREDGSVLENNLNSPFGEPLEKGDTRYGYESREYDSTSKDIDFLFRKYDPELKRFLQPDTLIKNVFIPQTLNRFSFELNNPYGKVDEDGHQSAPISQAEGGINFGIMYKNWVAKQARRQAARIKLNQRLIGEYYKRQADKSCMGCPPIKEPDVMELQKIELRENLNVIIDENKKIVGYEFEGRTTPADMDILLEAGYDKGVAKKVIKEKLNILVKQLEQEKEEETGEEESEEGGGGGGLFSWLYDKRKVDKNDKRNAFQRWASRVKSFFGKASRSNNNDE